jgi:hypothetical protein
MAQSVRPAIGTELTNRGPIAAEVRQAGAMDVSTWLEDFLSEPVKAGERTEQTQRLKKMLAEALEGSGGRHQDAALQVRRRAANQLTEMANQVWLSKESAGVKRSKAHTAQRLAAGGSAAAAAGSGGALAAGLGGAAAKVLGIVVVAIGILAGIGAAVLPEAEYERNREKSRRYEQIWWDIWNFALLQLPSIDVGAIHGKLEKYTADIKAVGEA